MASPSVSAVAATAVFIPESSCSAAAAFFAFASDSAPVATLALLPRGVPLPLPRCFSPSMGVSQPAPVAAMLPSSKEASMPPPPLPAEEDDDEDEVALFLGKEGMLELTQVKFDSRMRCDTTFSARSASWLPKQQCVRPTYSASD